MRLKSSRAAETAITEFTGRPGSTLGLAGPGPSSVPAGDAQVAVLGGHLGRSLWRLDEVEKEREGLKGSLPL